MIRCILFLVAATATRVEASISPPDSSLAAKFAITSIDVVKKEGLQVEFDGTIDGSVTDDDAVLLADVKQVGTKTVGSFLWKRKVPIFGATRLEPDEFIRAVQAEVDARRPHCRGVLLYIHGFSIQPERALNETQLFHETQQAENHTLRSLCIPVIWPSNGADYLQDKEHVGSPAARGFANLIKLCQEMSSSRRKDMPWGIMAHSMGNYLLRKFGELNEGDQPIFSQIFMVASDVSQHIFSRNFFETQRQKEASKEDDDGKEQSTDTDADTNAEGRRHPGVAIAKMLHPGGKVHVFWTRKDVALYLRRFYNGFERALGREGVDRDNLMEEFLGATPQDDLIVGVNSDEESAFDTAAGHSYQFAPAVIQYYNRIMYQGN